MDAIGTPPQLMILAYLFYYMQEIALVVSVLISIIVVTIACAIFKVKKSHKWILIIFVTGLVSSFWIKQIHDKKVKKQVTEEQLQKEQAEHNARHEQDRAVFNEQCKKAGEKIYRTVDNVDGVMLLKVRKSTYPHENDPMFEDAAMVTESPDDSYINSFLKDKLVSDNGESYIYMEDARKKYNRFNGYQFVDVQKEDGTIIRYSGKLTFDEIKNKTEPTISIENAARYIVTFENNVEPELRKHWVAGTTIKIIDRQTNELLAEKTIFAFAAGAWVKGKMDFCPKLQIRTETRFFAEKVLKPFQLTPSFNGDEK